MKRMVHARLDEETERLLDRLHKTSGLSESELIRRGIRTLAETSPQPRRVRIIGLGKFDSGIPDLATNKKHMEGFGEV